MIVVKTTVLLLAFGYFLLAASIYFSQRGMVYSPVRELVATPADMGLAYEDVHVRNSMGTELHGWWLPHPQPRFTLLFCHGNGGNISHREESFRIFHLLGLNVFIFDYSGYGRSQGVPSEKATRADALAAWKWLCDEKEVDPGQVLVFGRSLGGGVATRLTRDVHEKGQFPAGLILESTFFSLVDMGRSLYPWLPVGTLARYRYESGRNLEPLRTPALFIHSPEDNVVPFAQGKKLYVNYDGPKDFLQISGSHNSGFHESGSVYTSGLERFLSGLERAG